MKLIKFDAASTKFSRPGESSIRFHSSGVITLSTSAVEGLKLKEGDKMCVVQDEENPDDWYLMKDENGFSLRTYKGNNGLCFNNAYIAKSIINFLDINANSVCFKVATEATIPEDESMKEIELFAILTKTAVYKELELEEAD